jgi:hypothetical protein
MHLRVTSTNIILNYSYVVVYQYNKINLTGLKMPINININYNSCKTHIRNIYLHWRKRKVWALSPPTTCNLMRVVVSRLPPPLCIARDPCQNPSVVAKTGFEPATCILVDAALSMLSYLAFLGTFRTHYPKTP